MAAAAAHPTGAGFDLLLLFHAACALVGLGTVVVSGIQSLRLGGIQSGTEPSAALRRYFTPGINWGARVLYGVPVFGFSLLAASQGAYGVREAWVLTGLSIWVVVIALGEGLLWPEERRVQRLLHDSQGSSGELHGACQRAATTAGIMVALLLSAFVIMFLRP